MDVARAMDFVLVFMAAVGGYYGYIFVHRTAPAGGLGRYIVPSLLGGALFVWTTEKTRGYDLVRLKRFRDQITGLATNWLVATLILVMAAFLGGLSAFYSRFWFLSWSALALSFVLSARMFLCSLLTKPAQNLAARNVAIVGIGDSPLALFERFRERTDDGITVCGVFNDDNHEGHVKTVGTPAQGNIDDLLQLAQEVELDQVILALPLGDQDRLVTLANKLKQLPCEVMISVQPIGQMLQVRGLSHLAGVPLLEIVKRPMKRWQIVMKWLEDKCLTVAMLTVVAPLMLLIGLLIKYDSRGPVLFVQERLGFNNKIIRVLKFRTMRVEHEDRSGGRRTLPGDPRVTRMGRLLRKTSLDELPQLINVLRGEMSLVGPRPHAVAMRINERPYSEAVGGYAQRHRVKPGITGWAQINGLRGEVDSLERGRARVDYDLEYIERWSLWLDLKILALTLPAVWSCRNAY
jgi:Undecaprenyl-phosphate glucose phosphotransferase